MPQLNLLWLNAGLGFPAGQNSCEDPMYCQPAVTRQWCLKSNPTNVELSKKYCLEA